MGPRFWAGALLGAAVVSASVARTAGGLGHLGRQACGWWPRSSPVRWAVPGVGCCRAPSAPGRRLRRVHHERPDRHGDEERQGEHQPRRSSATSWAAFAYLTVVSMFLGFSAWYRGLVVGPMARVGHVQLVQPLLSLTWAALLPGERLDPPSASRRSPSSAAPGSPCARSGAQHGDSRSEQTGPAQQTPDLGAVDAAHDPLAQGSR
ncbi:EamA family transporter [Actinomycetota bacterium]